MFDISNWKAAGSRLLIRRKPPETTLKSGLFLSEDQVNDSVKCEVISVGPGEMISSSLREEMPVKVGDTVIVWQGYGHVIEPGLSFVDITEVEAILRE